MFGRRQDPVLKLMNDIASADVKPTAFMDAFDTGIVPEPALFATMFAKSTLETLPDGWAQRSFDMLLATKADPEPWIVQTQKLTAPLAARVPVNGGELFHIYGEWTVTLLAVLIAASTRAVRDNQDLVPALTAEIVRVRAQRQASGQPSLPLDGQLHDPTLFLVDRAMRRETGEIVAHLRRGQWVGVPIWDPADFMVVLERALGFAASAPYMAVYHVRSDIRQGYL